MNRAGSLAFLLLLASPLRADSLDASPSRLGWMEGRWIGNQDGLDMEEIWTSAAGGALVGMHKDVKAGRMTSFEYLRIEKTDAGTIYFASPRAAPPTPFHAIELGDRKVVFQSDTLEFPKRILYWLDEKGALHARIEGRAHGEARSEEWSWTKAK